MNSKITSVFILAMLSIVFAYDAIAAFFGTHATISEQTTNFIYSSPFNFAIFFLGIGIFIGHIFFSVNYNDK